MTHCSLENRKAYTQITVGMLHPEIDEKEICSLEFQRTRGGSYKELQSGMKFNLGGITVAGIIMKGHTPGSMCMLFCEERRHIIW